MEKMLWLQRVGGGCRFSKVSRKRVNDRGVSKTKGYACGPWSSHLLLESWFSRVEEKLWFFLPNFITLNASSALFT